MNTARITIGKNDSAWYEGGRLTSVVHNVNMPTQFTVLYNGDSISIEYPDNSNLDDKERAVIEEHFNRLRLPAVVGIE